MKTESLKRALNACMRAGANYQVRYADYEPNEFTIPVKLTPKRIAEIIGDFSVYEIKISIEP